MRNPGAWISAAYGLDPPDLYLSTVRNIRGYLGGIIHGGGGDNN